MKMIEYLSGIAPLTTQRFLTDIMYNYGINSNEFENKTLHNRLVQVRRFFGYSMTVNPEMSQQQIQEEIKMLFTDFEQLILTYPEGPPNLWKQIKEMSNVEKTEFFERHYKRIINVSLCYALVKGGPIKTVSLRDALVARIMSQLEQISAERVRKQAEDEKFWLSTINEFKKDELPPF